ncbi:DUF3131 domain-containing protein [Paracoccus sp. JM45]|uniref:DUF3131 domain-containing protein n=1 Tax=Paracoccus sp. JM45 TaxID=2283626 RepID=UPI000E6CEAED|nr:DUF3131 domain-containing protein [Paracoccus sp. JM45]RJE78725.1 DUF3131 domain-containing protein [Paracoccus sp. JM45]
MGFRQNLVRARGHIIFIVGLIAGLLVVMWLENLGDTTAKNTRNGQDLMQTFENVTPLPLAIRGESTVQDMKYARIAWTYFQNNTNPTTGLANSVQDYPSTTMWETGSYVIAILSAERLNLIASDEAEDRIAKVVDSLGKMRLFQDILPNKAYNTRTLELVDYGNKPSKLGLGWSALDVARIMSALALAQNAHPALAPAITGVLDGWSLDRMVRDGELIGTNVSAGEVRENQEGRVGYEQYAAKAMMLHGYDVYRAYEVRDNFMIQKVLDQPIPVDTRMHRARTPAFVVSEPYLFDGLEFGFDARSHRFATAIYLAQQARYEQTGKLTAVTESHLSEEPFFAYSTVWGGGSDWAVLTFQGDRIDSMRTMATKAAFGWDALFGTDYTENLVDAIIPVVDAEKGWPEGLYEATGLVNGSITANTNAVVLASLSFKATGPLMRAAK